MEASLEHRHRTPGEPPEQQPAGVTRRGGRRPARQLGERDRHGILEIVGKGAQPGAEDDPDLGREVCPGADGGFEGVESGGLIRGPYRDGRIEGDAT
jgi:hypothetical protein